ncbi:hypothetical protein G6N74_25035 [Mesorhizobium sp. CGMCC 1.15528]|uniref:Uncharacterized protein n=1 Tax=Mesorhizobium zhangyense TaxID=1776730 RepID=A0A7C9RAM2_9HYPH|nr:hypothetical protein [Mesorhizobium zhangyense]NGN44341.1 hypothetical protein [Mesorhizobium zhangyense]
MFNRTINSDGRGNRLERVPRIKGFGVAIDFLDGWPHDARQLDHSLFPERVLRSGFEDNGHRRFAFVEYAGEGTPPPIGLVRSVGDVFFVDPRVAEFVWQAVIEKIENDAAAGRTAA